MNGDICYDCDGTGKRDILYGAPCLSCGGTGWLDEDDEPWMDMSDEELAEYEQQTAELNREDDAK